MTWQQLKAVLIALVATVVGAGSAVATPIAGAHYDTATFVYVQTSTPALNDSSITHRRAPSGRPPAALAGTSDARSSVGVAAKGADDVVRLADDAVIVRGGTSEVPPPGEVFSGAYGQTIDEAGAYVPHGQLRATTAGDIRRGGGTVEIVPEMTRAGNLNTNHVNICLGGGSCPFGPLIPNPVPKPGRIQ